MSNNLVVHYLYRDASNYKKHGSVIIGNDEGVAPESLYAVIKAGFSNLDIFPDVIAFDPSLLGWPSLFFDDYNLGLDDVAYHELSEIVKTHEAPTVAMSAGELLVRVNAMSADK